MSLTKVFRIRHPQLRMVTAAALGDIVVEASDVQEFELRQVFDDVSSYRLFFYGIRQ